MRRSQPPDQRWPTPDEADLLRAAAGGEDAPLAWARWRRAGRSLADATSRELRLLPRIDADVVHASPADRGRIDEIHKRARERNQELLRGGHDAARALRDGGIESIALKGTARLAARPGAIDSRILGDVDLLVRRADAAAALAVTLQSGWVPIYRGRLRAIGVQHSIDTRRGDGTLLDLHWTALEMPGLDDGVWSRAVRSDIEGWQVSVPSPSDQLLITCVHGVGPHPAAPHWILDALELLSPAETPIDWDVVCREAVVRQATGLLAEALDGLDSRFGADVPAGVISDLRRARRTLSERAVDHVSRQPQPRGATYVVEWHRYRRLVAIGDTDHATSFADHLARRWGFAATRDLLPAAVRRSAGLARPGRLTPWADFVGR